MVWRFQYYSCLSVHRHHSASVPRNALSPRWSLDCFRNCCPRRRVQLRRRTSPSSSTTCALSYPRITPARPSQHLHPSSLRFPAPLLACRCLHLPPATFISSLHSARVVAQDGTQPSRPLFDTVCAACTAWLAVAESGAWFFPPSRINPFHLTTTALPLARIPFDVARPLSKASISTLRISVYPSSALFPPLSRILSHL